MKWKYRIKRTICFASRSARTTEQMTDHKLARNQDRLIKAAITNSMADSVSFTGNIPSIFLLVLGASPVHIGLLATFKQSYQLSKIIGLKLLPRLGKARLCAWGRVLSSIPLFLLAVLAAWPDGGHSRLVVPAIILFALRGLIVTGGNTGWQPLIQDSIRAENIGSFFGRLRVRMRLVDLIVPLILGIYLGASPAASRFIPLFLLAAVVKMAGCYFFSGTVEKPLQSQSIPLSRRIFGVLGKPSVRRYGLFSASRLFVFTAYHPFWVVVLNDHGLPAIQLVWLGTAAALGNVMGVARWGRVADRLGSRMVIMTTLLPQAALGAAWLIMPVNREWLFAWALLLYLAHGFLNGGLGMAKTRAMIQSVPAAFQAEGFVVAGYLQALGGAGGGIVGGFAYRWAATTVDLPLAIDPRHLYLALAQFSLIPVWLLSRGIRDKFGNR